MGEGAALGFEAEESDSGAVVCWGGDFYDQSSPPPSVDGSQGTAIAITAGDYHSCATQAETGAVVCWGDDPSHLGYMQPPSSVDGTEGPVRALAAGGTFTLAIPEPNTTALAAATLATLGVLARWRRRRWGRC